MRSRASRRSARTKARGISEQYPRDIGSPGRVPELSVDASSLLAMYFRLPKSGPVIMIADSGMLMGEVLQSSRRPDGSPGGRVTSLLWALDRRGAVLILPKHVVEEVERALPRRATAGDDIELAYRRLRGLYLARARVVEVPPDWAAGGPRVEAVVRRHPVDAPPARLALTLGYSFLLTEDPDLCDVPGLGFSAWLQITHAAANGIEVDTLYVAVNIPVNAAGEAIRFAARRIGAASPVVKAILAGVLLLGAAGAIWWIRSGRADEILDRVRPTMRELGRTYGPPLMETLDRYQQGNLVLARAAVPPAGERTFAERVARVLAFAAEPLLAGDIARALEVPGNLRNRERAVRAELRGCAAFVEVRRGRWMLGEPSQHEPTGLTLFEIADYQERLHTPPPGRSATATWCSTSR
jgi:hypothetical protein